MTSNPRSANPSSSIHGLDVHPQMLRQQLLRRQLPQPGAPCLATQHRAGQQVHEQTHPVELVFAHEFDNVGDAYAFEKQIQGWSRAKREALIAGDFNEIRRLSKKKFTAVPGRRE